MLFDADCGFCSRCAGVVPRLGCRVEGRALQSVPLGELGVDADRAVREMPVVMPDGRVAWGHHAWAEILRTGPLPLKAAGAVLGSRPLEWPASRVYAWVSQNRHRMPGGTAACAMPVAKQRPS